MSIREFRDWLNENHPRHNALTNAIKLVSESLLKESKVAYLAVTGRTKPIADCLEKSRRKKYRNPIEQLTDISGIRIIVYFDFDVRAVSNIIEENFAVDAQNSSNREDILSADQFGYRSVHYVCELNDDRAKLHEYRAMAGLKFEFQIRTVLQHAWAEIAHDRNYKFTGQLPKAIERKLFLLAGLLETADNGFSDLSDDVDAYKASVSQSAAEGELEIELNALSLEEFVHQWANKSGSRLEDLKNRDFLTELLGELDQFGVHTLGELSKIIPPGYRAEVEQNVLSVVRDWMLITDPPRFLKDVTIDWCLGRKDLEALKPYISAENLELLDAITYDDSEEVTRWEDESD
ncbi:GTP pyrophosphokinase [Rhizobium lentis]|uniref:GTP pyrophosphokinase n=1 Tax=Rhizobium lentis TaxID=1138194 RepID=UPI001C83D2A1|nr:GTP pyrophosphokinase [Rhizobium lentis]MBX4975080.1 GTP pyrophosphokinase [Rhizobium lentis]MBX4987334.1 GTP pyrophosphokinase [Rhizobium lentis]MBX5005778.1 GTP pyrophosphokinase [Rhizobium lentis]MBX5027040.1 GTP pyrophosphokinase [Rhizobium lentis]MBX5033885.1 GTP pyrophosphokinase [Rhizobium lentis]